MARRVSDWRARPFFWCAFELDKFIMRFNASTVYWAVQLGLAVNVERLWSNDRSFRARLGRQGLT
jgi:hypothetical protein